MLQPYGYNNYGRDSRVPENAEKKKAKISSFKESRLWKISYKLIWSWIRKGRKWGGHRCRNSFLDPSFVQVVVAAIERNLITRCEPLGALYTWRPREYLIKDCKLKLLCSNYSYLHDKNMYFIQHHAYEKFGLCSWQQNHLTGRVATYHCLRVILLPLHPRLCLGAAEDEVGNKMIVRQSWCQTWEFHHCPEDI